MSRKIASLCLFAVLMTISASGHAFDGKREGFIFGFGFGPSVTTFTQNLAGVAENPETMDYENFDITSDRKYQTSLAVDFRIGQGLSEKLLFYYGERTTLFSMPVLDGTSIIANGIGGLGASYYLNETCPSIYIHGLVGFSTWAPLKSLGDSWVGFGLGAGVGYEFKSHWSFEGSINYGNPGREEDGIDATTNAIFVSVKVFSHAY